MGLRLMVNPPILMWLPGCTKVLIASGKVCTLLKGTLLIKREKEALLKKREEAILKKRRVKRPRALLNPSC